jgi:hypothetical protein
MVKFFRRLLNRRYKGKDHGYFRYILELPARLNTKLEPHLDKDFDEADITSEETPTQEFLHICLVRNKPKQQDNSPPQPTLNASFPSKKAVPKNFFNGKITP